MNPIDFHKTSYQKISKNSEETSFYKTTDSLVYGQKPNNGKLISLPEIIKTFQEQARFIDQNSYDNIIQNGTTINKKIKSHNEKLNKNILYLFIKTITFGFYNKELKEINLDNYIEIYNCKRALDNYIGIYSHDIDWITRYCIPELEKKLGFTMDVQFTQNKQIPLRKMYFFNLSDSKDRSVFKIKGSLCSETFKALILTLIHEQLLPVKVPVRIKLSESESIIRDNLKNSLLIGPAPDILQCIDNQGIRFRYENRSSQNQINLVASANGKDFYFSKGEKLTMAFPEFEDYTLEIEFKDLDKDLSNAKEKKIWEDGKPDSVS